MYVAKAVGDECQCSNERIVGEVGDDAEALKVIVGLVQSANSVEAISMCATR